MQTDKPTFPRLFLSSIIDAKDEIEEKLDKARGVLQRITGSIISSEREVHDALQNAVCRDKTTHDDISLGLLACILTDHGAAQRSFRDLTFITRDNMSAAVDTLVTIATDKYHKLTDVARFQLIWVVKELMRSSMGGADILCWSIVRQIAGGDITNRNLWLAENMLEALVESRTWLEKFPVLVGSVIFTYLRILEDHFPVHLNNLRQKEVNFVVSLIRDHFATVIMNPSLGMGRDFVRLLQGVSRIPEIQAVWVDLFYNPKTLSPHFTGLSQLLNIRTSRKFLQCRLTPEMEKKIHFLTTYVKFGMHKRYQEWFQHKFLATPESQTLRADIIRFIVGVIHPPNEILCSDILPRWAVIGWLLTTCTSPVAAANAKLALFFDWLIFDPVKDNIMNIEPGILVMYHSIRPHLAITATLIDFLIRQITEFWPDGSDKIKEGIGSAFRTILEKKVLQSIDPVLDNPKLEPELRSSIQDVLIPLIRRDSLSDLTVQLGNNNGNGVESRTGDGAESLSLNYSSSSDNGVQSVSKSSVEVNHVKVKTEISQSIPPPPYTVPTVDLELEFSGDEEDDEDDDELGEPVDITKPILSGGLPSRGSPTMGTSVEEAERSKIFDIVQTLPTNLRIPLDSMLSNPNDKADNLEEVLEECSSVQIEKEHREAVVKALIYIYKIELLSTCVDEEDNSLIDDNVCASPVIEVLQLLLQSKPSDKTLKSKNLLRILSDMVHIVPRLGYKILLILNQLADNPDGPADKEEYYPTLYKNLSVFRSIKLEQALNHDVKSCWESEPIAVGFLCPIIYGWYSGECCGSTDILKLVVSTIDSYQLQDIVWRVAQGDFNMLDTSDILSTISKTLEWETWEQHCVWTLLEAHQFEIDDYFPVIPMLDYKSNAEALTALLLKFKNEKPSEKLLGPCLCRKPNPKDRFVLTLLICWSESEKDILGETLTALLVRAYGSPVKRKRGVTGAGRGGTASPAGPATPNMEYVLAHLDLLRTQVEDGGVFSTDILQAALLQVQGWVTDIQKNKYKDLLALAAIEESSEIKESRSVVNKRSATGRRLPGSPTSGMGSSGGGSSTGTSKTTEGSGGGSSGNIGSSSSSSATGGGAGGAGGSNSSNLSRTRSGRTTRQAMKDDSDSSSNDDDDEETITRSRKGNKRRKTSALNSDSD